jgi:hypothetical protein
VDKDAERQQDLLDVDKGLMSKVEYRMKWMGETETQAEEALKKIQEEYKATIQLQQTITGANTPTDTKQEDVTTTEKEDDLNKRKRANESIETNKKKQE